MTSQDERSTSLSGKPKRFAGWSMGSGLALGVGAAIGAAASQAGIPLRLAVAFCVVSAGAAILIYMRVQKKP